MLPIFAEKPFVHPATTGNKSKEYSCRISAFTSHALNSAFISDVDKSPPKKIEENCVVFAILDNTLSTMQRWLTVIESSILPMHLEKEKTTTTTAVVP